MDTGLVSPPCLFPRSGFGVLGRLEFRGLALVAGVLGFRKHETTAQSVPPVRCICIAQVSKKKVSAFRILGSGLRLFP